MRSSDRRVRRTDQALVRALIELILERGFDALTVSEITERADVGRSTFYKHYADKEDLLQGAVEGLRGHLEAQIDAVLASSDGPHPVLAFCLPMLEHADGNRDLFAAMVGRRGGLLILQLFHDMWADMVRRAWPEADELAVQAITGGFGSTMSWWLQTAPALSPQEVFARYQHFIASALPPR